MIDRKGIKDYLSQLNDWNIKKIPLRNLIYSIGRYEADFDKIDCFTHLSPQILPSVANFIDNIKAKANTEKTPVLEVLRFNINDINILTFCCTFNDEVESEKNIGNNAYELYPFFVILQVDDHIYLSEMGHHAIAISSNTLYQIIKIGTQNGIFQDNSKIFLLDTDFSTSKVSYSQGAGILVMADNQLVQKSQKAYRLTVEKTASYYSENGLAITTSLQNKSNDLELKMFTNIPEIVCGLNFSYQLVEMNQINEYEIGRLYFNKENLIRFSFANNYESIITISKYNIDYLKKNIVDCIQRNNDNKISDGKNIGFKKFTQCLIPSLTPVMELVNFGNQEMRKLLEQKYDDCCKDYAFDKDKLMNTLNDHLYKIIQEREKEKEIIGRLLFDTREELIV